MIDHSTKGQKYFISFQWGPIAAGADEIRVFNEITSDHPIDWLIKRRLSSPDRQCQILFWREFKAFEVQAADFEERLEA